MGAAPGLSLPARALVGLVVAGGAVAIASRLPAVPGWSTTEWFAFVGIAAAVAVAECFPIELSYSHEKVTYSLSDAVWTGALLTSPASVLILAVAAGVLVGQSVQTWSPLKVAFNVGQFAIGITAAVAVFEAFGSPAASEPAAWAAAAVAMAAFQAVNTVLMGAIISLTEHQPFWQVALVPTAVLHWIGNLSLGILGAVIWTAEPVALPLLLVPTVLTYLAYRGWLTTVQERDQMHELAIAADSISESGDLERRVPELGNRTAAGELGATLNRMLDRLAASFRRERLFLRQTSHELRTPITICRGHLEVLGPDPEPDELADTVAVVIDELDRMSRLVTDMTTLAGMEDPAALHVQELAVDRLVADVTLEGGGPARRALARHSAAGRDAQRRSAPHHPGPDQPAAERGRAHRIGDTDPLPDRQDRRRLALRGRRRGRRAPAGHRGRGVPAVLHGQGLARQRPRPVRRLRDRPGSRRARRCRQPARTRGDVLGRAATLTCDEANDERTLIVLSSFRRTMLRG